MRTNLLRAILSISLSIIYAVASSAGSVAAQKSSSSTDKKYAGTWTGEWAGSDGDSGAISVTLSKDEKNQWRGSTTYVVDGNQQTSELKSLTIEGGKFKAKVDFASPDGAMDVTLEATFTEDKLEGTYTVSPKGTTDVVAQGTWKAAKSAAK
jgi:hypothetical protein